MEGQKRGEDSHWGVAIRLKKEARRQHTELSDKGVMLDYEILTKYHFHHHNIEL